MEEIKKTTTSVKLLINNVYNKDGVLQDFHEFKAVIDEKGNLLRAKFKRTQTPEVYFKDMKKCTFECDYFKIDKNKEYPVVWIDGVHTDTIKKIY